MSTPSFAQVLESTISEHGVDVESEITRESIMARIECVRTRLGYLLGRPASKNHTYMDFIAAVLLHDAILCDLLITADQKFSMNQILSQASEKLEELLTRTDPAASRVAAAINEHDVAF